MSKELNILATAYAVNPFKGSEDGMGWNFIYQIARFNFVTVVTRQNNREAIEKYMRQHPDPVYQRIRFVYFDLPYWMRFWKRGGRGALLYYWMWQRSLPNFIHKQQLEFDIVHNVNFHNDWTPSYLWKLNKPFVWGPIGHHPLIPAQYLQLFSKRYLWKDRLTWLVKKFYWNLSPGLKNTIHHAQHIFCMNSSIAGVIDLKNKSYSIMPSVATEAVNASTPHQASKFTLISAGRLVPLKGFDLTILSFARFINSLSFADREKCELVIVGSGPEKKLFEELIHENQVARHVRMVEWLPRPELMKLYASSSAFIFPSHEGAGMVVAEALSYGLPVICLNNVGPGEFVNDQCGIVIEEGKYNQTVKQLQAAIQTLHSQPLKWKHLQAGARKRFEEYFHWNKRGEQLNTIYQQIGSGTLQQKYTELTP